MRISDPKGVEITGDFWVDGAQLAFTGGHTSKIIDDISLNDTYNSMILESTGKQLYGNTEFNFFVASRLSKGYKNKKAIGVYRYPDNVISVGEGTIWVIQDNQMQIIENGDLITSSEVPGFGMIQDDDLIHN